MWLSLAGGGGIAGRVAYPLTAMMPYRRFRFLALGRTPSFRRGGKAVRRQRQCCHNCVVAAGLRIGGHLLAKQRFATLFCALFFVFMFDYFLIFSFVHIAM
ncbi:hypothetical protein [Chromobacterium phragmitis]|uniref:hypothetical protein n=1 Tax=Chromobacterium phragmitis TaxID=2202141 RepID=UPI0011AE57FD|nr:hypothetical protein [Chromobacterium phragmitis]